MIPKTIHYIWLSDEPYTEKVKECMKSWDILKEQGYTFIKWDKTNFDINSHPFVKRMYDLGLYAFASDYIRLWVLYNYGGIYIDSDVMILRPFDELLNRKYILFGEKSFVHGCFIGADKGQEFIKKVLDTYDTDKFDDYSIIESRFKSIIRKEKDLDLLPLSLFDNSCSKKLNNPYAIHLHLYSFRERVCEIIKNRKR